MQKTCRGPEGEPIAARMGPLVYISSSVRHPLLLRLLWSRQGEERMPHIALPLPGQSRVHLCRVDVRGLQRVTVREALTDPEERWEQAAEPRTKEELFKEGFDRNAFILLCSGAAGKLLHLGFLCCTLLFHVTS